MELSVKLKSAYLVNTQGLRNLSVGAGESILLYSVIGEQAIIRRCTELIIPEGHMYLTSFEDSVGIARSGAVIALLFELSQGELSGISDKVLKPTLRQKRQLGEILRELEGRVGDIGRYGSERIIENSLSTLLVLLNRGDEIEINEELALLSEEVRSHSQAVRHYLLENYTSKITLDGLCYLFRTNKTALCKEFRKEFDKTVLGYLHELRIAEAKRLLREGNLSVTAVSDRLGFESIHYFSRLFKNMVGISPTEYARAEKLKLKLMEEL